MEPSDKQKRLSTKTKDHREASKLWDKLEREIYAEFGKALQRDPYLEVVALYWDERTLGSLDRRLNEINGTDTLREMNHEADGQKYMDSQGITERPVTFLEDLDSLEGETLTDYDKRYPEPYSKRYTVHLVENLIEAELVDRNALNNLFEYLNEAEALDVRYYLELMMPEKPYLLHLQQRVAEEVAAEASIIQKREVKAASVTVGSGKIINTSGCPTIRQLLPDYLKAKKWDKIRDKTKKSVPHIIKKCVEIINDLPID